MQLNSVCYFSYLEIYQGLTASDYVYIRYKCYHCAAVRYTNIIKT